MYVTYLIGCREMCMNFVRKLYELMRVQILHVRIDVTNE